MKMCVIEIRVKQIRVNQGFVVSENVKMQFELFTTHYFINSTVDKTKT